MILRRFSDNRPHSAVLTGLAVIFFAPVFFQLNGELYTAAGEMTHLPLPFSILVCALGVLWFGPQILRHRPSQLLAFSVALMVVTSALVGSEDGTIPYQKISLFMQFALPMAALGVGHAFGLTAPGHWIVPRAITYVLLVVIPGQLLETWNDYLGPTLAPRFFGLGIYGHLQYMPTTVVALYLIALAGVWRQPGAPRHVIVGLVVLAPLLGLYIAASMSMLAMGGLSTGLLVFAALQWRDARDLSPAGILVLALGCTALYLGDAMPRSGAFEQKFALGVPEVRNHSRADQTPHEFPGQPAEPATSASTETVEDPIPPEAQLLLALWQDDVHLVADLPPNVGIRLGYWRYYITGLFSSPSAFLFGQKAPPDSRIYPSAHNYYLDLAYNFGVLPLLPMLVLLIMTILRIAAQLDRVGHLLPLAGLVIGTLFLIVGDNATRVGMRLPYFGMIAFFLWGLLLARLSAGEREVSPQNALPV